MKFLWFIGILMVASVSQCRPPPPSYSQRAGGGQSPYPYPGPDVSAFDDKPFGITFSSHLSPEQQERVLEKLNQLTEKLADAVVEKLEQNDLRAITLKMKAEREHSHYDMDYGGGERRRRRRRSVGWSAGIKKKSTKK